jgi:hypothetical protein
MTNYNRSFHILAGVTALLMLIPAFSYAQFYDYVPVGARSIGMGGTGIASARGGETIYHNPALMGFNGDYELTLSISRDTETVVLGISTEDNFYRESGVGTHFASVVAPLPYQEKRMAIGIAHYHPMQPILRSTGYTGSVDVISPAFAFRVNDRVRLGAALNIWTGSYSHEGDVVPLAGYDGIAVNVTEFSGMNFSLGSFFKIYERYQQHKIHLGIMMRTGFALDADGGLIYIEEGIYEVSHKENSVDIPTTIGVGLNWIIHNRTTLTAEYDIRSFHGFFQRRGGKVYPAVVGHNYHYYEPPLKTSHFRLGGEYELQLDELIVPLRGGFRIFQVPTAHDNGNTVNCQALTLGTGIKVNAFRLDIGYELTSYSQDILGHYYDSNGDRFARDTAVSFEFNTFVLSASVNIDELWK